MSSIHASSPASTPARLSWLVTARMSCITLLYTICSIIPANMIGSFWGIRLPAMNNERSSYIYLACQRWPCIKGTIIYVHVDKRVNWRNLCAVFLYFKLQSGLWATLSANSPKLKLHWYIFCSLSRTERWVRFWDQDGENLPDQDHFLKSQWEPNANPWLPAEKAHSSHM